MSIYYFAKISAHFIVIERKKYQMLLQFNGTFFKTIKNDTYASKGLDLIIPITLKSNVGPSA